MPTSAPLSALSASNASDSPRLPALPALNAELDLQLQRWVPMLPSLIWKAWTTPHIMLEWFCPRPWKTIEATVEPWPGGVFRAVMQSPEGQRFPPDDSTPAGCVLVAEPDRRLVWTNALVPGLRPAPTPTEVGSVDFAFTAVIDLQPEAREGVNGTLYTARALHRDARGKQQHEAMGFEQGWGICLDQLLQAMR